MKKVISILLVLVAAAGFAFADDTATLNLKTTVDGAAKVKIVAGGVPESVSAFTSAEDLNNSETAQTVSTSAVTYAFAVKTNATSNAQVTLTAKPLGNGSNAYIKYSVTAGNNTSTATNSDGAPIELIAVSNNVYTGMRVIGATFKVQAVNRDNNDADTVFSIAEAPAGTYTGSVVITYTTV
jgi:hypothetical protein